MPRFNNLRGALAAATILAGMAMISQPAYAQASDQARATDIPAGTLGNAIAQLGRKHGVMIAFDPALVRGRRTAGLHGTYSTPEALDQLLAGSDVAAHPDGRGGFTLVRSPVTDQVQTPVARQPRQRLSRQPSPAPVQEIGGPEQDIVVTAARTELPASALPMTVDVIQQEEMARQLIVSGSVVDALSSLLPAFSPTQEKSNVSGVTLRGRKPLYTIDGVPQSTPIRNDALDGYTIDPFFIDRIEVIYGSNALQGIGATGGVINQVTVKPSAHDGISGRVLLQGNAGDDFSGASLGGKVGGLLSYRAGPFDVTGGVAFERRGVFLDGNDRRIGFDANRSELQDTDSLSFFGRVGVDLSSSTRLEVVASRYKLESNNHYVGVDGNRALGIPATSVPGETAGTPASSLRQLVSASLIDKDLAGGNFTLMGFYENTRNIFSGGFTASFQDASIAPIGTLFEQSANKSRKLGAKVTYEREIPGIPDLTATVGFDALFDRTEQYLVQTSRVWVPQTDFRSLAPFGQLNWGLFHNLVRLAGGVRYENDQLDIPSYTTLASYGSRAVIGGKPSFNRALWNGGVVVEPIQGIRLYGSYAEGFTIADIGRILRGINVPNVEVENYLNLTPVVSNNREIGIEIKRGPLEAGAGYYWSSSDFGEVLVRGADGLYSTSRQPVSIHGLDINLSTLTPLTGLKLSVGYNHILGRTDSDGDGRLDVDLDGGNIAPDRLNLTANYRRGRLDAQVQGRFYLSRSFEGQPAANSFAGYALLDAYVGYQLPIGQVSLSVQNLTNAQYITYLTDTQGPTDNVRFYAGRGRNFTLSWNYRF